MADEILKNKPLVEAIFELKWRLVQKAEGGAVDPQYSLFVGRLFERVKADYPYHQALDAASIPDEITPYIVKHQFRAEPEGWPLMQVGPGIVTLNETEGYVWSDFHERIRRLVHCVFDAYPDSVQPLVVESLLLRYIDAMGIDLKKTTPFQVLEMMKVHVALDQGLFDAANVIPIPTGMDIKLSFKTPHPPSALQLRFASGRKGEDDALIWETQVQALKDDVPKDEAGVVDWASAAHKVTRAWFQKTIEGELRKVFE